VGCNGTPVKCPNGCSNAISRKEVSYVRPGIVGSNFNVWTVQFVKLKNKNCMVSMQKKENFSCFMNAN